VVSKYTPRPAQRYQLKLRMALAGPSKSGKTYNALQFAGELGSRICVIDAEQGSAQKYCDLPGMPSFDIIILEGGYTPEDYITAIEAAGEYDTLVIDSISPEWVATLEIKDEATLASRSQNAYTVGWRVATPRHDKFVHAMLAFPGHLIVTIRQKTAYTLEKDEYGNLVPKKAGMDPIQRPGIEFDFDILCELNLNNMMTVEARCQDVHGKVFRKPTGAFMDPIKTWLGTGAKLYTLPELFAAVKAAGGSEESLRARMAVVTPGVERFRDLHPHQIEALIDVFTPAGVNGQPA
jgi:hypothetical protein